MFVAFDLDNTLGCFEIVGPLAYFMSPEFLENPEERVGNPLRISKALRLKLANVRKSFAINLLKRPDLLHTVLRPNLDSMILPVIKHKATTIIYSNTWNVFSAQLAKDLIERAYKIPIFSLVADVFHPLRAPETKSLMNPDKTFPVLERLLRAAAKRQAPIHPEMITFVDDREPMHPIANTKVNYIKPTPYIPKVSKKVRQEILQIALDAMDIAGLLSNPEYLDSAFCYRKIKNTVLRGFPDLFSFVWKEMQGTHYKPVAWRNDTFMIEDEMRRFFEQRSA